MATNDGVCRTQYTNCSSTQNSDDFMDRAAKWKRDQSRFKKYASGTITKTYPINHQHIQLKHQSDGHNNTALHHATPHTWPEPKPYAKTS